MKNTLINLFNEKYILDAGMTGGVTAAAQVTANQDPNLWPLIIGVFAPIVKEALFRLIDRLVEKNKQRKKKNNETN